MRLYGRGPYGVWGRTYLLNAGDDASIPYGAMRTGWVACDDGWHFFNASGAMERCWLLDGSNWYWLDPETGVMATVLHSVVRAHIALTYRALWFSVGHTTAAPGIMPILLASSRVGGCMHGARGIGSTPQRKLWRRAWWTMARISTSRTRRVPCESVGLNSMAPGTMPRGRVRWMRAGIGWLIVYWLDLETRAMATGEFEAYGDHYYALGNGAIQMSGWAPYGEGLALLKSNGA